jgi:Spy/CpxP family protein refolding chaperone
MRSVYDNVMKSKLLTLLVLCLSGVFSGVLVAQDVKSGDVQAQTATRPDRPRDMRMNFLRGLGLSNEQIQQIRQINIDRRPLMEEAQTQFREANKLLDAAIYADQVNENDVEMRLKDVQKAQAEISRIRFMTELALRRVLTPEQLVRFRELRQRFEQARHNDFGGRHGMGGNGPLRGRGSDSSKPAGTMPSDF